MLPSYFTKISQNTAVERGAFYYLSSATNNTCVLGAKDLDSPEPRLCLWSVGWREVGGGG